MIELSIQRTDPRTNQTRTIEREQWPYLNYLVGPNGSGKTLLAYNIRQSLNNAGLTARYVGADRLMGFEKENSAFGYSNLVQGFNISQYSTYRSSGEQVGGIADAYVTLQKRPDLKLLVESRLSALFGRSLHLSMDAGFLKVMVRQASGSEYEMKQNECHGLKELTALLTVLYDDSYKALIIDEPEMHLHPQLQMMLMSEVRTIAGDPREQASKKLIFLVTHSPFIVSLRSTGDLEGLLVLESLERESWFDKGSLDEHETQMLDFLLLRINAEHRSLLFTATRILVEGYTDRALFEIIQEKRATGYHFGAGNIIDAGGKEELAVIRKLCLSLGLEQWCITDLDALLRGRLIQDIETNDNVRAHLAESGQGTSLLQVIGALKRELSALAGDIGRLNPSEPDAIITEFQELLRSKGQHDEAVREAALILLEKREALEVADFALRRSSVLAKRDISIDAASKGGLIVLKRGEIEHYMTSLPDCVLLPSDSQKIHAFHAEMDLLRDSISSVDVCDKYPDLCGILDKILPPAKISLTDILNKEYCDFMHRVQMAVRYDNVTSLDDVRRHPEINALGLARILLVEQFSMKDNGHFECVVELRIGELAGTRVRFSNDTPASASRFG